MKFRLFLIPFFALLFLPTFSMAQKVLLEKKFTHDNKSITFSTSISQDAATVTIKSDQSADTTIKKKKGETVIEGFIRKIVNIQLVKYFSDEEPSFKNKAQIFAEGFSKISIEKLFPPKIASGKKKEIIIENYGVGQFQNGNDYEFYVWPIDRPEDSKVMVSKKNGKYVFTDISKTHPLVSKQFSALLGFITEDPSIAIPFVYASGVLILNEGNDAIQVTVPKTQAEEWFGKERVSSGEPITTLKAKPVADTTLTPTPTPAKKNQETILIPAQQIKCNNNLTFELSALTTQLGTVDSFQLELNTAKVKKRLTLPAETGVVNFKREVKTQFLGDSCTENIDSTLAIFYVKLTEKIVTRKKEQEESARKAEAQKFTDSVKKIFDDRIAALGAEQDYAALLECRKSIPLYTEGKRSDGNQNQNEFLSSGSKTLMIDSIVMRVSNNTVYQIDITGNIDGKPIQTLSNNQYGLSFRNLIDGNQRLNFLYEGVEYHFFYRDIFFARPTTDGPITYEIRDASYHFYPDSAKRKSQLIEQKRLIDYVSASAFVDLLAFNAENTNKNLLTELYFNYHINPYNWYKGLGFFKNGYFPLSFGVNLFKEGKGMETFRRKDIVGIDSSSNPFDTTTANKYYFKNIDLLRNAFLQIRPMVNIVAIDAKMIRTIFEVNSGFLLTGSNARLTDPAKGIDSNYTRAVYSYAWASEGRIRLNPRPRYGFDIHVLYSFGLQPLNTDLQSVTGGFGIKDLGRANKLDENKDDFILGEINFFYHLRKPKTDTDKGGLYFKFNWYKSTHYRDGHFMFLVGYSTDIKNFLR